MSLGEESGSGLEASDSTVPEDPAAPSTSRLSPSLSLPDFPARARASYRIAVAQQQRLNHNPPPRPLKVRGLKNDWTSIVGCDGLFEERRGQEG